MKSYFLYLSRWQLSSPILAACLWLLPFNTVTNTVIANLIGAMIFFWADKWIFGKTMSGKQTPAKTLSAGA